MTEMYDRLRSINWLIPSSLKEIWQKIKAWLRRDGIVIVLFVIATILMSYPLAFRLDGHWLALRDTDTYVKLWDNWWLQNFAFNEPQISFTNLQFHPTGLDLTYHSISWTVAPLAWALSTVSNAITAYNLTILIGLFTTAYAAYLLAQSFMEYRAAAWLAGAIYSFAPYHVAHAGGHPDLIHLAPIPIAVLLLFIAMTKPSVLAALGAALMIGLAGLTSLYIMVFALLTIGPIFIFLLSENRRWSRSNVWPVVITFIATSIFLLSIRLVPIFRDTGNLTEAIDSKLSASQNQTDLLSYILPPPLNPLFGPITGEITDNLTNMSKKWPAYLGIISIALTIAALTWKKRRKITLLWLSIGLLFFILSLGPVLLLNGNFHESIVLPARLVSWFPPIKAVGRPDLFVIGVLLPLAMLAAYGFDRLLLALADRRIIQIFLMALIPVLLLTEYWAGEFPGVSAEVSPFYEQLSGEKDNLAIIDLPMGRYESKRYLYLQTIHQKPIVEGLSARTPEDAYHYILNNSLLLNWSHETPLNCSFLPQEDILSALDDLVEADFGYVVIHHEDSTIPFEFSSYFSAPPIYQDSTLTAYKLVDLRDQPYCTSPYSREYDLPSLDVSTSIAWDQKLSLLGHDQPLIDREANVVAITMYWQALTDLEKSYTAYFHLIDPETDTIVAQADIIPRGWSYPTDWWVRDEVVDDMVQIPIENVPEGRYELRIGWYDQGTGKRLKAVSDQLQVISDGSVILTEIED